MSDLFIPSAVRVHESKAVSSYHCGKDFRGVQHTTEPLGNWKLGAKTGPAIHSTEESAKRWFQGFKSPYNILCCFTELNSYNYFRWGKKKFQRDLESGPQRIGFNAIFQRRPLDMMAYSLLGEKSCGYPSNYVSEHTPQVSVEGCAADVPSWPDSVYKKLGGTVWYEIFAMLIDEKVIDPKTLAVSYRDHGLGAVAAGPDGKGRMVVVDEWMTNLRLVDGHRWNLCAHSDLPGRNTYSGKRKPGQSHWDAPFDFERLCWHINAKLQASGAGIAKPTASAPTMTVPKVVSVPADKGLYLGSINVSGDRADMTYSRQAVVPRPQQVGQAAYHLGNAKADIETAIKLLTPKPKPKSKKKGDK